MEVSTAQQIDLTDLEVQLKKRWSYPQNWNFKFNSDWESRINFVYETSNFEDILNKTESLSEPLAQYAVNRWYNFWSMKGVHHIFLRHPAATPPAEPGNDSDEFILQQVPFRIKLHVYPYHFARTLRYAICHEEELLYWLYHKTVNNHATFFKNHIFIMLYNRDGEHWTLKAELQKIGKKLKGYLDQFDVHRSFRLHFAENKLCYADVIWLIS